jgi:hypothetical protein
MSEYRTRRKRKRKRKRKGIKRKENGENKSDQKREVYKLD